MRFLVLGAGSLGGYFGAKLLKGGATVHFLVRPARAAQLASTGLVVRSHEGEFRAPVTTVQAGAIAAAYDAVLLCCKAYDLDTAMDAIAPAIGPGTAILPVLNGIRHLDTLSTRFGATHVLGGLTAVNAALGPQGEIIQSPVKIDMTAFGELDGTPSPRCQAVAQAFAAAGLKATLSDTVRAAMWAKFTAFCAVAAIMTLCRARAGAIAAAPAAPALIAAATNECYAAAAAEGFPAPDAIREIIRGLFTQPGSTYGPSILLDMEQGRRTEAAHTIGDLVARAATHALPVPVLTAALCNLQIYEATRH